MFMDHGRITRIASLKEALARSDSPVFAEEAPVTVRYGRLWGCGFPGLACFDAGLSLSSSRQGQFPHGVNRLRILARELALVTERPRGVSILNMRLASPTAHSVATLRLSPGLGAWGLIKSVALLL
ncbi:hypothetical protein [Thiobacter aerophilum]|uniref:Uncharacterized protein n=1 Tax=Thiobacter aerophilum TaxID=3121275 RepID=A0ABV0EBC4_9BURK